MFEDRSLGKCLVIMQAKLLNKLRWLLSLRGIITALLEDPGPFETLNFLMTDLCGYF